MITYIGVEIGTRYTKVVELVRDPRPRLLSCFRFVTPRPRTDADIEPKLFWEEVGRRIPLERVKRARLAVDLPCASLVMLSVNVPKMGAADMAAAAISEARRKMIPISGTQHVFECILPSPATLKQSRQAEVLVMRAEKAAVDAMVGLFKHADAVAQLIIPAAVVLPLALARTAWKEDADTAFVDIGHSSIKVAVARQGRLVLNRVIAFGLQDVLASLSLRLGLDAEQALKLLLEQGVPQVEFDLNDKVALAEEIMRQKYESGESGQANPLELRSLWQAHIDRIVQELRRSFVYYKESCGRTIGLIRFLGGGSQVPHLISTISQSLGGDIAVLKPLSDIQVVTEKKGCVDNETEPMLVNAASLACSFPDVSTRPAAQQGALPNFLPPDLKQSRSASARRFGFLVFLIVISIAFAAGAAHLAVSNHLVSVKLRKNAAVLDAGQKDLSSLRAYDQQQARVQQISRQVDAVLGARLEFAAAVQAVAAALPDEIVLLDLHIGGTHAQAPGGDDPAPVAVSSRSGSGKKSAASARGTELVIQAKIYMDYEGALERLASFRKSLIASGRFSSVECSPLVLEAVAFPDDAQGGALTQARERMFTVKAVLADNVKRPE